MVMAGATRIEAGAARRATVIAGQIIGNGKLGFAYPTENGPLVVLAGRPWNGPMPGQFFMALVAGVIRVAALRANGDDIQG